MEDMTVAPSPLRSAAATSGAICPRDLREWIRRVGAIGQHQRINALAPLVERIKGGSVLRSNPRISA